jgi:hypothetical protein
MTLIEALQWALAYVRLPDGENPEAFARQYLAAARALQDAKEELP